MRRSLILLVCVFGITACGNFTSTNSAPAFHIRNADPTGTITYATQADAVVFELHSPRGIGSARITQTSGAPPKQIALNLHLRALEQVKFSFGNQSVEIEIPTTGDNHTPRQSIPPGSPLYMPTKIVSRDNEYPIQDGYIQIELPRAYFEANAREFSIEWIDFYR